MYKIAFFCIPAYGHTNPTIEVIRELCSRGHEVWYYSYNLFQKQIESAGAKFISCDPYDVQLNLDVRNQAKVGKDVAFSIRLLTETTLALDEMVCRSLKEFQPDCVIADSMAVWGKFAALKLDIPFICSTTTFAFNRYSSQIMKPSLSQTFSLLKSLPSVNKNLKRLQAQGYPVKNLLSIIQNDNDTNTVVYTSKEFQPCADTFSDKYLFVGPSIPAPHSPIPKSGRKMIYISMGTVNNQMLRFYQNCIEALRGSSYDVIMSVGENTDISALHPIPSNFTVKNHVSQIDVLQSADVFLSHCGMNSINEGLYYSVPFVLYPQTAEQGGVANRVSALGAGVFLEKNYPDAIKKSVETVLADPSYKENAAKISQSFHRARGAAAAADGILRFIREGSLNGSDC